MSIFLNPDSKVPVTHEEYPGDTIYIRARIDYETYARIEESLMKLEFNTKGGGKKQRGQADDEGMMIGARYTESGQRLALLVECVKAWDGPTFTDERGRPVPCNRRNIAMLDPHHPLVERVLEELDARNRPPTEGPVAQKGESPNPSENGS